MSALTASMQTCSKAAPTLVCARYHSRSSAWTNGLRPRCTGSIPATSTLTLLLEPDTSKWRVGQQAHEEPAGDGGLFVCPGCAGRERVVGLCDEVDDVGGVAAHPSFMAGRSDPLARHGLLSVTAHVWTPASRGTSTITWPRAANEQHDTVAHLQQRVVA